MNGVNFTYAGKGIIPSDTLCYRAHTAARELREGDVDSGVLAALLKGKDLATAVQWGAAHGILVQQTQGDITLVDEKAVLLRSNAPRPAAALKRRGRGTTT